MQTAAVAAAPVAFHPLTAPSVAAFALAAAVAACDAAWTAPGAAAGGFPAAATVPLGDQAAVWSACGAAAVAAD